jgi:hypothetical protein
VRRLPHYDYAADAWVPRCPHGTVCSGCDAAGRCSMAYTPWGEPWDTLAQAALADPAAPPVLAIAAWLHLRRWDSTRLHSLVASAMELQGG